METYDKMTRDETAGTVLTFALGAGVGAALALLFAPKSGAELRGDIAHQATEEFDQIRRTGDNLKRQAQKAADLAQDQVEDAIEAGREAYARAKNA